MSSNAVDTELVSISVQYAVVAHGESVTIGEGPFGYRDLRTHITRRFPTAAATCRALDAAGEYDLGEITRYVLKPGDSAHRVLRRERDVLRQQGVELILPSRDARVLN